MPRKRPGDVPPDFDAKLLLGIGRGDQRSFEMLYDRYAPAALGVARRLCGDRNLAEDVVQESFLSIWRRPASYKQDAGTVAAYLFGVVHNKAVDSIRHEESVRRREQAAGELDEMRTDDEVVESAWLAVRRDQVREAVKRLSQVQREAIELAYFEGQTYAEVAAKLGIPLGTAKTRLRDGMIRLRNVLRTLESQEAPL